MPRALLVRRTVISLLLAVSVAGLYFAFTNAKDAPPLVRLDSRIESVQPAPGSLAVRQDRILVDLVPGLTGIIQVDRVEIPEDQLVRVAGLNQFSFTPGPGTETGPLSPGLRRLTVIFWPIGEDRTSPRAAMFTWSVNVA
ncbi:MAG: hypothetical protein ACRD0D_04385 [Acidimicrobiales bacterium]